MVFKRTLSDNPFGAEDPSAPTPPVRRARVPRRASSDAQTIRFTPSEEKRALILAHAARHREPDRVQQWSLALGVGVCVVAVGLGWAYAMRESITHAFDGAAGRAVQELGVSDSSRRASEELEVIMQEIETVKARQAEKLQALQAVQRRLGGVPSATSVQEGLFRAVRAANPSATGTEPAVPSTSPFRLPPGAEPDAL